MAMPILGGMFSGGSGRAQGHAPPRILLVDDDRDLLVPLAEQLRRVLEQVRMTRDLLAAAGLAVPLVTGAGTGTMVN